MKEFGETGSFALARTPERAMRQLRFVLMLFFLALLVPLGALFKRVYEQLENEVLLQNRTAAEQLVAQVDSRLREVMNPEEARSFDEYNFYKVDSLPLQQSKGLIYSPLSEYPPKTGVPGVIGYFQVNPDGTLQSPILPKLENGLPVPEIKEDDLARRVAAWDRLYEILAGQSAQQEPIDTIGAVAGEKAEAARTAIAAPAAVAALAPAPKDSADERKSAEKQALNSGQIAQVVLGNRAMNQQLPPEKLLEESPLLERAQKVTDLNLDAKYLPREEDKKRDAEAPKVMKGKSSAANLFGRMLDENTVGTRSRRKERVDLAVTSGSFAEVTKDRGVEEPAVSSLPVREQNLPVPPAPGVAGSTLSALSKEQRRSAVQVLTLEGEVDPFQFRVLDKLHFLFIRKVWRDSRRFLQGFVVDGDRLVQEFLASPFQASSLAPSGNLIVGYRGVYFRRISGSTSVPMRRALDKEIVLYRGMLSPPFERVELLFTAAALPPAPGATLVNTLAYAIAGVILIGLFGLYRLGVRQILFAKERSDFVSAVSHELKTPLTSIRMYSEMLRSGWVESEEKKRSYYDFIFRESERLSRLIANVLQFARLSHSASALELKREPARRLLEIAEEKVRSQIEGAGFELSTEYEDRRAAKDSEAEIEIEEDAFLRIAINLVDNALKFSAKADTKRILLAVRVEPREVTFSVRDFGPGVAKEQMKKIFQLFYRAEDEMNRNTPGTGIGLALVRELAAKMNAAVDLRNVDPGAEFLLKLPIRSQG